MIVGRLAIACAMRLAPGACAGALALLLVACGESYRGEPLRGPFPTAAASAADGAPSEALLVEGERVFARYCHQCHPGGAGGLAPAMNNKPAPGWLVALQVRIGMGAMPAFPRERIDENELDALVEYVLALRRHGND